jgi:hypothetical protein
MVSKAGTLRRVENIRETVMWILVLEAGAALLLLVFIVWWTMFSGRAPEQPPARARKADPAPGPHEGPGQGPAGS